jgi:hypothetical protein
LVEEPAQAQERDPRIQAAAAASAEESRAMAVQAQKASAEVAWVQAAVPEATTAAARELAFCLAMKVAMAAVPVMAADVARVLVAEQEAEMPVGANSGAVPEERVLAEASLVKKGSTAFCAR